VHPTKAYRGSRGIAPLILSFCTSWRSVVNLTPRFLFCIAERNLALRISQEQGIRKETKDNGGFETEHLGRSGRNFSQHAATCDAELPETLGGECVDNKGRHITDTIFRK